MDFIAPTAFAFLATLPVVILFYLLKRKRVTRVVPSTLLWERFLAESQANAPFQKLRKNWLLFLQLFLLLLAILALARPYFSGQGKATRLKVLVLDASASMQATDEAPSRFEAARKQAKALVDGLRDRDEAVVVLAGPLTEVRQSSTSDKRALQKSLDGMRAFDTPTRLAESLKLAATLTRAQPDSEVHLFSDGAAPDLADIRAEDLKLVYHKIGKAANNVGIVGLEVRAHPEDPSRRAAFINVQNHGPANRQVALKVTYETALLETRVLSLAPTGTVAEVVTFTPKVPGILRATLEVEDDLKIDNSAFASVTLSHPTRVLLLTHGNKFIERALKSLANMEVVISENCTTKLPECDVVVVDNLVPSVWPERNILTFKAAPTNWFAAGKPVTAPSVVDTKVGHPLLRSVNLDNVEIASANVPVRPSWAVSIAEAREGALVLAGELQQRRIVHVAFDLLDSTWPLRLSFPIFMANAVDWLNPQAEMQLSLQAHTGNPLRLKITGDLTNAVWELPGGVQEKAVISEGSTTLGTAREQGIYRLRFGTNVLTACANLADAGESDTQPREEMLVGARQTLKASVSIPTNRELWRWLALGALAVLMFEWWYYHKRTA